MPYAPDNSVGLHFRNILGCGAAIFLVPIAAVIWLVTLPFARPIHRSTEEVVNRLREFVQDTSGEWDMDDFISIPIADPRLEAIRYAASDLLEFSNDEDWRALLAEAEAISAHDRASLIEIISKVITGHQLSSDQLNDAIPHPRSLPAMEKDAYEALSHWTDDEDIRAKDSGYAAMRREELIQWLKKLESTPHPPSAMPR